MTVEKQYAAIEAIERHIASVRTLLTVVVETLTRRAEIHDRSKLEEPELAVFGEIPRNSKTIAFGSPEYLARLELLRPALEHHYAVNRHHPEHLENGIAGMTLIDLIEMYCDWLATNEDYRETSFVEAIERNQARFGFGDELKQILINTAEAGLRDDERPEAASLARTERQT